MEVFGRDGRHETAAGYIPGPHVRDNSLFRTCYEDYKCTTCGRLPFCKKAMKGAIFKQCPCKDCWRFCCKRPCFEVFYRSGHREACLGKQKGSGGVGSGENEKTKEEGARK
jgi:hypothetical protein